MAHKPSAKIIPLQCSGCQCVHACPSALYPRVLLWHCSACGHPNKLRPPFQGKVSTLHEFKHFTTLEGGRHSPAVGGGQTRSRAGFKPRNRHAAPLEDFRRMVQDAGRVFVLGTAPSLNNCDLLRLAEAQIPTIGVNLAWKKYQYLDALVLADFGVIRDHLEGVDAWQNEMPGRYIFWMGDTKVHQQRIVWQQDINGTHGHAYDAESGEQVLSQPVRLKNSNVQYFRKVAQKWVWDLSTPLALNFQKSVIFPALNLAALMGAKEIYLAGVECENNSHFYDVDNKPFPASNQIFAKLREFVPALQERGIEVRTCLDHGTIAEICGSVDYEAVATAEQSPVLRQLRDRIRTTRKCFVIGAGPNLNQQPLQLLAGWPTIGVNTAFLGYPLLDVLMFADPGIAGPYRDKICAWQRSRQEPPMIFWYECAEMPGFQRIFPFSYAPQGSAIFDNPQVTLMPRFSIRRSIVTPAINLAYWLGAKEIYLLGVELDTNKHFWDERGEIAAARSQPVNHFPGADDIVTMVCRQHAELANKGVSLYTCHDGGLLRDRIPYKPLASAANPEELNTLFLGLLK